MYIFKAGVVGAGYMGAGIVQVITYSGLPTVLKLRGVDPQKLENGLRAVRSIYQERVDRGKMSPGDMQGKMDLLTPTFSYDDLRDVDIVIEAVPENADLKKQVFAELDSVCPEHTIFATNTSALSISELAAATRRPQKVVGMHFFSPVHVMKLVEVIPGLDTSQETIDDAVAFAESLRKIPVVVRECAGFLVNRLLMRYLIEATRALQEGAATAPEIDSAMVEFGWPMGPFTLMDMLGTDVVYDTAETMGREYNVRIPPLLKMLVDAGRLGEKSGAGFYGYGSETDEPVKTMIQQLQREGQAGTRIPFSWERLMMPLINEAARCLTEQVAPGDKIDMAMVAGTGMKYGQQRMGPLQLADEVGLDRVVAVLEELEALSGNGHRPAHVLKTKVRAGHLGKKVGKGFLEYTE